jgi:LPXTG-motif cell wall-anchored protein
VATIAVPTIDVINALPVSTDLSATSSLALGTAVSVRFSGFDPFEFVQLIVASTPQVVGSGYADAQGDVLLTGTLPMDLAPGDHRLVVYAPTSGKGASQSISVAAAQLPATGVNSSLVLGMMLIAIGVVIYGVRRRTRRDLDPQWQW